MKILVKAVAGSHLFGTNTPDKLSRHSLDNIIARIHLGVINGTY